MASRHLGREHRLWSPRPQSGLLLDLLSVSSLCAVSCSRKLRTNYSGAALRVRRSSDSAEQDIGFAGNLVDTAAIATFCSGTSGFVRKWYDQGSGAHDLGNATTAAQPRIYTAGALEQLSNGVTAARWLTAAGAYALSCGAGALGISGSPALTAAISFSRHFDEDRLLALGTNVSGQFFLVDAEISRKCYIGLGSGNRQLNYTTTADLPHSWILKKAASAQLSAFDIEESGTDLTQSAITNGTNTLSLQLASCNLVLGNDLGASDGFEGRIAAFLLFDSLLAGTDLTALRAEMAAHA